MHTRVVVLLCCLLVITVGTGFLLGQTAASTAISAEYKKGDVNQDGKLDIMDLLSLLGRMSSVIPGDSSGDLDGDGKTGISDLLSLLRELSNLRAGGQSELAAIATINSHLLCEPKVIVHYPVAERTRRGEYYGELQARYSVYANREIDKVEFIFDGETLCDQSGITPVLLVSELDSLNTENDAYWSRAYIESEKKSWLLKVWDRQGNCFADSGQTRFSVMKYMETDRGGSPNIGLPIEFPFVLRGAWQRFGLVHPNTMHSTYEDILTIDLNPEEADSLVFNDIDQLSEAITGALVACRPYWGADSTGEIYEQWGPFISPAVSVHTGEKTNRLLIEYRFGFGGGFIPITTVDGNEAILEALGFPEWLREVGYKAFNNNYELAP